VFLLAPTSLMNGARPRRRRGRAGRPLHRHRRSPEPSSSSGAQRCLDNRRRASRAESEVAYRVTDSPRCRSVARAAARLMQRSTPACGTSAVLRDARRAGDESARSLRSWRTPWDGRALWRRTAGSPVPAADDRWTGRGVTSSGLKLAAQAVPPAATRRDRSGCELAAPAHENQ
jgi:hypothetical protein